MKIKITYKKVEKASGLESISVFEMDFDDAKINLTDGFWLLNLEKFKQEIKLELWQGEQFIITISLVCQNPQTLHLKFYDFDIFVGFELCE